MRWVARIAVALLAVDFGLYRPFLRAPLCRHLGVQS